MRKHEIKKWNTCGLLLAAVLPVVTISHAQTTSYYFTSTKDAGAQEIPFADGGNPNVGGFLGGGLNGGGKWPGFSQSVGFGSLSGVLNYDPIAQTLDLHGSVPISSSGGSGAFSDYEIVNGVVVPATVSINYTFGNVNNGIFSFDTGIAPYNPLGPVYSFDVGLPISGTYSLVTGGQTYNGTFSYVLNIGNFVTEVHFSVIDANDVSFEMDSDPVLGSPGNLLAQATADDGVQMDLVANDPSDGATYAEWHVGPVIAETPEPCTITIFGCGLAALALLRRRKS